LTVRTPEVVASILDRLASGEPLAQICRDQGMPHPTTWRDWCHADEALSIAYARARDDGFDAIAGEALRIADTPRMGEIVTEKGDGTVERREEDMLGHRRLQIETRLKLLAKWDPKRYGDKVQLSGDGGGPIQLEAVKRDAEAFRRRLGLLPAPDAS
jgi:hypothetical protein